MSIVEEQLFIIAGGNCVRKINHGNDRHLWCIAGESILSRNIRLLSKYGQVHVIIPPNRRDYSSDSNGIYYERQRDLNYNLNKYLEVIDRCDKNKPVMIVGGDVYLTQYSVTEMLSVCGQNKIMFYCRYGGNLLLKHKRYGGIYGAYVHNDSLLYFEYCVNKTINLFKEGKLAKEGSWELAKICDGIPIERVPQDKLYIYDTENLGTARDTAITPESNDSNLYNMSSFIDDIDYRDDYRLLSELISDCNELDDTLELRNRLQKLLIVSGAEYDQLLKHLSNKNNWYF